MWIFSIALKSMVAFKSDFAPDPPNNEVIRSVLASFCYREFLKAVIIRFFSLLPSVERRSSGIPAFFRIESFKESRFDCSEPALWKAIPSTSIASTGCLVVLLYRMKSTRVQDLFAYVLSLSDRNTSDLMRRRRGYWGIIPI